MVRDLKADLELCNITPKIADSWATGIEFLEDREEPAARLCVVVVQRQISIASARALASFIAAARHGWPEAIQRAIEAEARVAELEAKIGRLEIESRQFKLEAEALSLECISLEEEAKR